MLISNWLILFLGLLLFINIFVTWWWFKNRFKISAKFIEKVNYHLQIIPQLDYKLQIIEYDKLLDLCLKEKRISGSLGEKMKKYGKKFVNESDIWQAHKLRNKLAHEMNFMAKDSEYKQAINSFKREIKAIINLS